ncbi:MAG: pirin family protein [Deltaproteobacteria bacterium]|nr:pirin family protein [Deltaproteobacteria bacterium]
MIAVRHADERGRSHGGWLDSRHTFSFADYHDPEHMGFGALRVINDDWVNASAGFGSHPHRDMEIISYVLSGALGHKDNIGNGSTIRPGDVQRMSAGTGVVHSEWNHSKTDRVHFLQIWIVPDKRGLEPGYEQRTFEPHQLRDRLALVASRDGRDGSVTIHQDAALYATKLSEGKSVEHEVRPGRRAWVQVAHGSVTLNGTTLEAGDGAAVTGESRLALHGMKDAEVLVFDLA